MRLLRLFAVISLACQPGWAQDAFEVASVKVALPLKQAERGIAVMQGGPGTDSPQRVSWRLAGLIPLIQRAYGFKRGQIMAPAWMGDSSARYDIVATLRPGATLDQFALMIRTRLEDRFHLRSHRELRERPAYTLTIASGGSKLKRSEPSTVAERLEFQAMPGGDRLLTSRGIPLTDLVAAIEETALDEGAVVIDQTGLDGLFDIALPSLSAYERGMVGLNSALQKDLGLKLERGRALVEVLVIDEADKVPTDN